MTSRVYWKARLESMCGSGAESGAEGWGGADVAELGSDFEDALRGAAEVVVPLAQATVLTTAMVSSAEVRLSLANRFTCAAWEQTEGELISRMKFVLQSRACGTTEVPEPMAMEAS